MQRKKKKLFNKTAISPSLSTNSRVLFLNGHSLFPFPYPFYVLINLNQPCFVSNCSQEYWLNVQFICMSKQTHHPQDETLMDLSEWDLPVLILLYFIVHPSCFVLIILLTYNDSICLFHTADIEESSENFGQNPLGNVLFLNFSDLHCIVIPMTSNNILHPLILPINLSLSLRFLTLFKPLYWTPVSQK